MAAHGDAPTMAELEVEDLADELQEFVYGTLTVMVGLGALSGSVQAPLPRNAIAVIVLTAFATLLAHSFSSLIALHVRTGRAVQRAEFRTELRHSWRIVLAALPAVAMFVLAGLDLFSSRTALRLSTALAVVAMIAVGVIAARRSHSTWFGGFVFVVVATAMGLAIVAIEIFVHHL
jgi:hypothetical protein